MGTHVSGPSTIIKEEGGESTLREEIKDKPWALGEARRDFGDDLPFLFKVLSVKTALSIQSHPDKKLAERLHGERPDVYKDDNHKPEMAVALSDFEALCGFCDDEELRLHLTQVPELAEVCGRDAVDEYLAIHPEDRENNGRKKALKRLFTRLMTAKKELVGKALDDMMARIARSGADGRTLSQREQLVLRLHEQYHHDVGVLSSWFLNYVKLNPGEAIALAANEPHAYISGEIVECMATSDNVIRAGLTPKFKDCEVLCSSLTYKQGKPLVMAGEVPKEGMTLYRPDFKEFEVWSIAADAGKRLNLPGCAGPMIMLMREGSASLLHPESIESGVPSEMQTARGNVLFVPANVPMDIHFAEKSSVWVAAVNGMGYYML